MTAPAESYSHSRTTTVLRECAICQSSIYPAEQTTRCDKCGLVFHAECWTENFGCASYGCEQVNVLAPKEPEPEHVELPPPVQQSIEPLPWDFLLLGLSALCLAASMLMYGIPSIAAAALLGLRVWKKRNYRNPILISAAIVCLTGICAGYAVSRFWFARDYTHAG
jgi:hypothetical protein